MTILSSDPVQSSEPFEEHLEILGRELEMAIKWQRPCILLVVYSSVYAREDAQAELENFLIDLHQKTDHIRIKDRELVNSSHFLKEFRDPEHTIYFVEDLYKDDSKQINTYKILNSQRDFFVENRIRVVFWLTQNEVTNFVHYAPDFWAQRHCLIELNEATTSEQILQETIDSVWLGIGDRAEAIKGSNEKVSLCKSLLNDLPQGSESDFNSRELVIKSGTPLLAKR